MGITPNSRFAGNYRLPYEILFVLAAVFFLTSGLILSTGTSPIAAYYHLSRGALGSWSKVSHVLTAWAPLTLCSVGLLYTFRIGLWNIGIEGQMMMGAIFTTAVLRSYPVEAAGPSSLVLSFLGGIAGGSLWGLLSGYLKVKGRIHEIFSGLGLNFVGQGVILWLIFGPWRQPGTASMSGTEPFSPVFWLPRLSAVRISPVGLSLVVIVVAATALMLHATIAGLRLKAIGSNPRAARIYGMRPGRHMLLAMACAGGMAGLAGSLQVADVYHRLLPAISSNHGYLGLLVAMVAGYRIWLVLPMALVFACLNVGSIQLPMVLGIDSSLAGVVQGLLVLTVLGVHGWQARSRQERVRETSRTAEGPNV